MSRVPIPTAILDLPDTPARTALRAGLMAMRVHPEALPGDRRGRDSVFRQLADRHELVAFIGISHGPSSTRPTLLQLDSQLPRGDDLIAFVIARLGHRYDLKNVTDLMRYLLPTPPVPVRCRRRMLALGSGDPTRPSARR
jgi:hypothetical protein